MKRLEVTCALYSVESVWEYLNVFAVLILSHIKASSSSEAQRNEVI